MKTNAGLSKLKYIIRNKMFLVVAVVILIGGITTAVIIKCLDEGSPVEKWVSAFKSGDISTCDSLVKSGSDDMLRALNPESDIADALTVLIYDKVPDAISDIELISTSDATDGAVVYTYRVTFKPYRDFKSPEFDTEGYLSLCKQYNEGDIGVEDYVKALEKIYTSTLNTCFDIDTDAEEVSIDVSLTDVLVGEDEHQVVGVSNFRAILFDKMNLTHNLLEYNNNLSDKLDTALSSYK